MKNINTPNSIMKLRNLMDSIHNNVVFQKTNQIHLSHSILQARLALANINTIKTNANLVNFPIIKASVQHSSLALQTQAFMSILDYKAHIFSIYPELKKSLIFEKTFNENIKIYNALIDSAILIYQNTTNEEIEVKIETQSESIILKRNLIIEYIEIFKNLDIPDNIATKLAFVSYILLRLAPLIYVMPVLIPAINALIKIFIIYGSAYIQELQQFKNPEVLLKKLLTLLFHLHLVLFLAFLELYLLLKIKNNFI